MLSSQIEGTQSSLSDLLLFESDEAPGAPLNDVVEVSNYVEAMNHGLRRIEEGFPLSLRLIKEIHAVLLDLKPSGRHYMEDFHKAGGMATLLRELKPLLRLDALTVTGAKAPGRATFCAKAPDSTVASEST